MVKNVFVSSLVAVALAGAGLSCDDPGDPSANEIARVEIVGPARAVLVGQTIQFDGRAVTNSDIRVDELVTWEASASGIISISAQLTTVAGITVNRATITGVADGGVDLIARAGSKSASVRLTVSTAGSGPS